MIEILPELKDQEFPDLLDKVYTTGISYMANEALFPVMRKGKMVDGYYNFVYQPYCEVDNTISGVTVMAIEVTKQVKAKNIIEKNARQLQKTTEHFDIATTASEVSHRCKPCRRLCKFDTTPLRRQKSTNR